MSDPQFELMCNPDKFSYGKGGFSKERPRKLTYRKYFNARLLDINGRFAGLLVCSTVYFSNQNKF